jgi:hypothetical protein
LELVPGFCSLLQRWRKHTLTATEEAAKGWQNHDRHGEERTCLAWFFFCRPLLKRPLNPFSKGLLLMCGLLRKHWVIAAYFFKSVGHCVGFKK